MSLKVRLTHISSEVNLVKRKKLLKTHKVVCKCYFFDLLTQLQGTYFLTMQ